jgi:hypothetical protein
VFYGGSVGSGDSLWFVLLFSQTAKLLCNATGYSTLGEERRSLKHDIGAEISCILSMRHSIPDQVKELDQARNDILVEVRT